MIGPVDVCCPSPRIRRAEQACSLQWLHFATRSVVCISRTCRRAIVPQDNTRVNRADEKCKLVKLESDTMGACDHPTIGQPQRCGRFGSTHCYPCSRCFRCFNSSGSTKRSRADFCMDRACRLHVRVNLADELAVPLSRSRRSLLPNSKTDSR